MNTVSFPKNLPRNFKLFSFYIFFGFTLVNFGYIQKSQASIVGKVVDENGQSLPFVNVQLQKNGKVVSGATTDFDGEFVIKEINLGTYDLGVYFVGCVPYYQNDIKVDSYEKKEIGVITLQCDSKKTKKVKLRKKNK